MQAVLRSQVLDELRARISRIEGPADRGTAAPGRSTGFTALDQLLLHRGLKPGTLVEWLSTQEGSGTASLALAIAGALLREGGLCIVVDPWREFYPPGAQVLGIPLERTVVLRPPLGTSLWWGWEQALRCPGVTVTIGWVERIDDRVYRRLQLAAETGGNFGFLLRPTGERSMASCAATRLAVQPLPSRQESRRVRVEVLRGQGGGRQTAVELELGDEAGDVPVPAELADPAPSCGSARG